MIILPRDATPVDFAYAIHSEVGACCVGATVNGRIVPLRSRLKNGDIVEIQTQTGHLPSRDWLSFVKTSRARNKIRHFLNVSRRERAIELGKRILEKEAKRIKLNLKKHMEDGSLLAAARPHRCERMEQIYSALGFGKISGRMLLSKFVPPGELSRSQKDKPGKFTSAVKKVLGLSSDGSLKVKDIDGILVYRAKCCNPDSRRADCRLHHPGARESPSMPNAVPTWATFSTKPTARSMFRGPVRLEESMPSSFPSR